MAQVGNSQPVERSTEQKIHTVKSGENLSIIAKKYQCTVTNLKEWNNLKSTTLSVGQKLKVYPPSKTSTSGGAVVHTVKSGDNLWDISKKYGVSVTCFCPGWVDTEFIDKATADTTVSRPKKLTPMLSCEKVVRGCLKAVKKRKTMYVTGKYTKMQHVLFKLLPDSILTKLWLGMQIQGTKEG